MIEKDYRKLIPGVDGLGRELTIVSVPAGRLKLRLVNEKAGVDEFVFVDVEVGKPTRKTVSPKPR